MDLFDQFPHHTHEQWTKQLLKELGEGQPEAVTKTLIDGLLVNAYPQLSVPAFESGALKHRIEHHPDFAFSNDWEFCVSIPTTDIPAANKQALALLEKGASSLRFSGFHISNQEELILILRKILPDVARIHFDASEACPAMLYMYADEINRRALEPLKINGSICFDPLGNFAFQGTYTYTKKESLQITESLIQLAQGTFPNFKTIYIKGSQWHNAGATAAQELAFVLAISSEYFSELADFVDVEVLAKTIQIELASGGTFFVQLAKFRAMRILWKMLLESYKSKDSKLPLWLSSVTAQRNKTVFDAHNNLIRSSLETMAAVAGGTDEHLVLPFDLLYKTPDTFSQRIALNIQHLLKEESRFDKVKDASAGSPYIEELTKQLAEEAWGLFCSLEESGGFTQCLKNGIIQEYVAKARKSDELAIATRKKSIIGVSHFANVEEAAKQILLDEPDPLQKAPEIELVKPYREAEPFEQLRIKFLSNNTTPYAYLVCFGDSEMHKIRSGFVADLLASAGISVKRGNFEENLVNQLSKPEVANSVAIVFCAADEDYAQIDALDLLDLTHQKPTFIARKPYKDSPIQEGISGYIFHGCNALEVLSSVLKEFHKKAV